VITFVSSSILRRSRFADPPSFSEAEQTSSPEATVFGKREEVISPPYHFQGDTIGESSSLSGKRTRLCLTKSKRGEEKEEDLFFPSFSSRVRKKRGAHLFPFVEREEGGEEC
jgi:hypothetical protein